MADWLSNDLGQQVIVENRAGAAGRIGTTAVAKSPADGYTLLLGSSGTITSGPAVFKSISYDPVKDFVAIGAIQSVPIVLTAAPKTPVSNFKEFVALANSKAGGLHHRLRRQRLLQPSSAIELLMRQANLKLVHVPYKGSGPAITDLLGSQVETMMDQLTASIEHIRNGASRRSPSAPARSPLLPNVPTLAESGADTKRALSRDFAPAGIPDLVADKLTAALRRALSNEEVRKHYQSMGVDIMDMSRAEFSAYVRADYEKWRTIAREGNIVVE